MCDTGGGVILELAADSIGFHAEGIPTGAQRDHEAGLGTVRAQAADRRDRLLGRHADQLGTVAGLDRPPQGARAQPADPDRDLVRGFREHADLFERVMLAVERHRVLRPTGAQDRDDLVHPAAAIPEIPAQRLELGLRPSDAGGDGQPSVAQRIEARERVGERERVVVRQHEHTGAQPDIGCGGGTPRERHQRVVEVRRGVRLRGGVQHVVADPDIGEAERVGVLRGAPDRLGSADAPVLRQMAADPHV